MGKYNGPQFERLADARQYVTDLRENGVVCPCCERYFKMQFTKLNGTMAGALMWMHRVGMTRPDGWIYMPDEAPKWIIKNRDFTKMQWWDLIENKPNDNPDKRSSGIWRITQKGIDFAMGQIEVPSHVYTLDRVFEAYSALMVKITDVLHKKWSYQELRDWSPSDWELYK